MQELACHRFGRAFAASLRRITAAKSHELPLFGRYYWHNSVALSFVLVHCPLMPYDLIKAAARARAARSKKNAAKEFIQERFWSKVDKRSEDECWLWRASTWGIGYGSFRLRGKSLSAHRFAYEDAFGESPGTLCVLHKCDNPPCCNPKHLFLGTNQDNTDDCIKKGRFIKPQKGEDHPMRKLSNDDVKKMRKLYRSGHACPEIATMFNVKRVTVAYAVFGKTWTHIGGAATPRPPRGESHGGSRLNKRQAHEIKLRYQPRTVTMQSLADEYHVGLGTVFDIIHSRTWKDA